MHVALTDILTCPRCGPGWGLVLLPGQVRDRRVEQGVLGCPNCRERYTIEDGVADLRVPGQRDPGVEAEPEGGQQGGPEGGREVKPKTSPRDGGAPSTSPAELAVRLGGLLGLAGARHGTVVLAGPAAGAGAALAELVEGVTVVGTAADAAGTGITALQLTSTLPFQSGSVAAVALTGAYAEMVEEGARVTAPAGRLLLDPAPEGARARLEGAGLRAVAAEGRVLVAAR